MRSNIIVDIIIGLVILIIGFIARDAYNKIHRHRKIIDKIINNINQLLDMAGYTLDMNEILIGIDINEYYKQCNEVYGNICSLSNELILKKQAHKVSASIYDIMKAIEEEQDIFYVKNLMRILRENTDRLF